MWDGYGDGWQSDGLEMIVNGESSTYTIPSGNYNSAIVNVDQNSQKYGIGMGIVGPMK